MNLRRGLLRIWAVGSILWLIGWPAYLWESCDPVVGTASFTHPPIEICRTGLGDWKAVDDLTLGDYASDVGVAFALPIGALALGYAVAWAVRGFRPGTSN